MNKGLKALYSIKTNMQHLNGGVVGDYNPDAWDIIEKSLKALEIIKEKRVDVTFFDTYIKWNWEKYQNRKLKCSEKELIKEEYDLLKEVLL